MPSLAQHSLNGEPVSAEQLDVGDVIWAEESQLHFLLDAERQRL